MSISRRELEALRLIARQLADTAHVPESEIYSALQRLVESSRDARRRLEDIARYISIRRKREEVEAATANIGRLLTLFRNILTDCMRLGSTESRVVSHCMVKVVTSPDFLLRLMNFLTDIVKEAPQEDLANDIYSLLEEAYAGLIDCTVHELEAGGRRRLLELLATEDVASLLRERLATDLLNAIKLAFRLNISLAGRIVYSLAEYIHAHLSRELARFALPREARREHAETARPMTLEEAMSHIVHYLREIYEILREISSTLQGARRALREAELSYSEYLMETSPIPVPPECAYADPFRYAPDIVQRPGTLDAHVKPSAITWIVYPFYYFLRIWGFTVLGAHGYVTSLARDIAKGRKSLDEAVRELTQMFIEKGADDIPRDKVEEIVREFLLFVIDGVVERDLHGALEHYLKFIEVLRRLDLITRLMQEPAAYCYYLYLPYVCKVLALYTNDSELEARCDELLPT